MKRKSIIAVTILLLAIGFAAISTTLIINGSTKVGENTDDLSVIFTKASLDGKNVYNSVVDDTKKIITFETSDLKTLNQTSVLNYEVTNNSANYDAEVQVNCKVKDNTEAKYTSIKNELENNAKVVKAKETLNGTLTVTLNKTATEEVKEQYVCELTFNAVERDTIGETKPTFVAWIPTYFEFGTPTTLSTTDYTTLGKNVFVGLDSNNTKGVCINEDGLFCIESNDFDNSKEAIKNYFGESSCDFGSSWTCSSETFYCQADSTFVWCKDNLTDEYCEVYSDGDTDCGSYS